MSKIFETNDLCRICESEDLKEILDLGDQPPANSLYGLDESLPPNIPLRLYFCNHCFTVQLTETVEPEYLFSEYLWVTGTSNKANDYSFQFADSALNKSDIKEPYVIEIASNDGTFLKPFMEKKSKVLGIDPAKNIAELACKNGINTIAEFFNIDLAKHLIKESGYADIVFARNVIPHVKNIHSVIDGISTLLENDGVGIIEFHDAGLILEELHYDSIYHEHLFYFSLGTISGLLEKYKLFVFDIMPSPISGGSWVIYFSKNRRPLTNELQAVIELERNKNINTLESWQNFAIAVKSHAKNLKKEIYDYDKKILAYGASARSSTLLNYCNLNSEKIGAVMDKNPMKQGLYTPGTNIPIISFEDGIKDIEKVEVILLLAWNFKDEIITELRASGFKGKFIIPLPSDPYIL